MCPLTTNQPVLQSLLDVRAQELILINPKNPKTHQKTGAMFLKTLGPSEILGPTVDPNLKENPPTPEPIETGQKPWEIPADLVTVSRSC